MQLRERHILLAILAVSALLGTAFTFITPVWANVEEPAHFEYIRYIVTYGELPQPGDADPATRQQIIDSFVWAHRRWGVAGLMRNARVMQAWGIEDEADWQRLRDELPVRAGYETLVGREHTSTEQFGEAPGYYLVAAVSQLFVPGARVETQLYAARLASVALGVLSVWLAALTAREMFPERWALRLAPPVLLALLPSFVVLQSTVNNTIAAVAAFSFAMYAAIRLVRRGYGVLNLLLVAAAAAACLLSKTTAYAALPALLLAVPLARQRAWPRWMPVGVGVAGVLLLVLAFEWHWPANWYPVSGRAVQVEDAPDGERVMLLTGEVEPRVLWQVMPAPTVQQLRGQTVTIGAWMRALEEPVDALVPGLWVAPNEGTLSVISPEKQNVSIGTEWSFHATVVTIPDDAQCLAVQIIPQPNPAETPPIAYDGVVMATGERPLDEPPIFEDRAARHGEWGGEPFENLVQNGSAERGWPLVRPELGGLDALALADSVFSLNPRIATFLDWRTNAAILSQSVRWLFSSFWSRFGWTSPGLPVGVVAFLAILTGISGVGLVISGVRTMRERPLWERRALALTALAGAAVVGAAIFRLDPIGLPGYCDYYQGRFISTGYYIVPGALPLLTLWYSGLNSLTPQRGRRWLLALCVAGFFMLTMGTLFGRMIPSYLDAYGVQPVLTLLVRLWGGAA